MSESDVKDLSPQAAWDMVQSEHKALLIDIRSTMEYLFVGHPVGSVHVPWIDEPDWKINPQFVTQIRMLMLGGLSAQDSDEGVPVVLICRSGRRSLDAGKLLLENGFNRVHHVDSGFEGGLDEMHHRGTINGWRHDGLPWEQC